MKRLNETNARVMALLTLLVVGCGSEDKPATENTNPDDKADAGAETSAPPAESTAPDETSGPAEPSGDGLGDPVLEDVPPATELSELDEDQLAEVCVAYVKTATAVSANLGELCPTQGLFQATQNPEVTDDESYQAECAEQVAACEVQVAAAQEDSPEERCANGAACGATVEDFNDCNAQIAALNRLVLEPLTDKEVSECSETALTDARDAATLLGLEVLIGLNSVTREAGGSPTDEDGPCSRVSAECPELGVALGAFSDLGSQLP